MSLEVQLDALIFFRCKQQQQIVFNALKNFNPNDGCDDKPFQEQLDAFEASDFDAKTIFSKDVHGFSKALCEIFSIEKMDGNILSISFNNPTNMFHQAFFNCFKSDHVKKYIEVSFLEDGFDISCFYDGKMTYYNSYDNEFGGDVYDAFNYALNEGSNYAVVANKLISNGQLAPYKNIEK